MSLLGMRGTAGPQPRQGLAQGRPEGHVQGQGCCVPSRGLSGLAPAGDTGPGEAWGRGEPLDTVLAGSSGEPHLCSGLSGVQGHGWDWVGWGWMGCPLLPCQAGGQGQPHARGPTQVLAPLPTPHPTLITHS